MTTKIDFYVLPNTSQHQAERFACKLAQQLCQYQQGAYVLCDNTEQAERIDKLLWGFEPTSFVPHSTSKSDTPQKELISIGTETENKQPYGILINLSAQIIQITQTLARLIEVVYDDETAKKQARKRYRHYRDQGHTLTLHP